VYDGDMPSGELQKQNITISLSRKTIEQARLLASRRATSISGLLTAQIEMLVKEESAYHKAERQALDLLSRGFHMGGAPPSDRDSLHER
jgi:hypothetical protein